MKPTLHIVSTGTSLLANFASARSKDIPGLTRDNAHHHSDQLLAFLCGNPTAASAEINALEARTGFLKADAPRTDLWLTLLHTETEPSKRVAAVLEKFLSGKVGQVLNLPFRGFDKPANDHYDPEFASQAASKALEDLGEKVSSHIDRMRKQVGGVEINCTGGFKAESAILHAAGCLKKVPVYYMHESFRCCVTLPPIR